MEHYLPYGITQRYLLPDTSERPAARRRVLDFSTPKRLRWKAEIIGYLAMERLEI